MFDKITRYFKGKNPYLLASLALVLFSLFIIAALIKIPSPSEEESVTETMEESYFETTEEPEALESGEMVSVKESEEMADVETKAREEEESAGGLETAVEEILPSEGTEETEESDPVPATKVPGESEKDQEVEAEIEPSTVPAPEREQEDPEPKEEETSESEESMEEPVVEETEVKPEEVPEKEPQDPPHEHSWIFESYYQKPTCSNGGLINQICARCGETQTTGGTPTGEHLYKVESPGDCCSAEVVICSECNHREVREKDPDNHIDEEDGFCYGCGCETE